jgi:hypothetical protein
MSTDGAGNLSWVTAGGGGATALSDLSDVAELNLQNNDLLMYNSVASEWQNTNLGVSINPTLSGDSESAKGDIYTFTVTNHATYDDPAYFCEIYDNSGGFIFGNSSFTDNTDGTISITMSQAVGVYEIRVKCQDFGDLQSEIVTLAVTTVQFGGTFRYWRFTADINNDGVGVVQQFQGCNDVKMYSLPGLNGTKHPTSFMTSDTAPTPFVATSRYTPPGASYDNWKAFDNNMFSGWVSSFSANLLGQYLQIDLGSAYLIQSMIFKAGILTTFMPDTFGIYGSNTGAFAGEETLVGTKTGMPNQGTGSIG